MFSNKYLWLQGPGPDSRIVYIDGAFDLFHAGHVEVLLMILSFRFGEKFSAKLK